MLNTQRLITYDAYLYVFQIPADLTALQCGPFHHCSDLLLILSFRLLQDAGILPQPAERQLFGSEDSSRAETTKSHQPCAK